MNHTDTICATATAQGGAIGIIRVSGTSAIDIVNSIFSPIGKFALPLKERKSHSLIYGQIKMSDGEILDDVLVSLFKAPHSYTGEDSVEISCHGSNYILTQVLHLLLATGCRMATPGEFTQRAFLNGKMDLSQAEAVADLISSSSQATHRIAMNQMKGGFSKELRTLRDKLLHLTALMELELDFSDHEDLEFADRSELEMLTSEVNEVLLKLINSFRIGTTIKEGVPVAIIGATNTGKSTLLNVLLQEEKAIISNIHGTTRDIIEDTIQINGVKFRFIDTAGIRKTDDIIENIGIQRSFVALEKADIVLLVQDLTTPSEVFENFCQEVYSLLEGKKIVVVQNKCDEVSTIVPLPQLLTALQAEQVTISAKENLHIERLQEMLIRLAALPSIAQGDTIVTNIRHYEALKNAQSAIERVRTGLSTYLSGDFISQDLREATHYLGEIIGELTTDNVLHHIFKNFCIGK
ncbi:MAG: tRNA uridine-5-carboxymethylaminomethyl(34) synthesis GTPase MnmE [Phocaeicola sp.]|nr:tRNA uridine-5-carboxymethylaminomethyl(34) synthesis GTPase MnmE [Phocaeicola sp.]MDD7448569.1 tRNA uridine-5-carboxymethylaminomethyl(34) synthesis GTPase MnmE [Prevotellaceae bacterium]MDY3913844.1 tRNA uridine-5-carboxymethylaminomethyl(34) synthesis GTPase MnmE [Phocaeicola sp.]MDY5939609.1 tRNA uridine-5-carboxymethylaminomethyl(34) synthesis GTPase MnmE [Phocaeicola sp.]